MTPVFIEIRQHRKNAMASGAKQIEMFNLIVSGNGESWEKPPFTMERSRFGEYSGDDAQGISLKEPDSLEALIGIPTLLMYELGASGENARLVRFGRLTQIKATGRYLQFDFEPDPDRGYMRRSTIQEHSEALGMARFEDHRTHWAIKDGEIPAEVLQQGLPEPPARDVKLVSSEYLEALAENNTVRAEALKSEIKSFPPSQEKATEYLRCSFVNAQTFGAIPHLGISRREGREFVEAAIEQESLQDLKQSRPYSLVWLLEEYGSPTEEAAIDECVAECEEQLRGILAGHSGQELVTEAEVLSLFHCIRSHTLTLRLRRVLNALVARFALCQAAEGFWSSADGPDLRTTAMMAVILERLGNDSHRSRIRDGVLWLCQNLSFDILTKTDVVAAALGLEAIRRSGMLSELGHITDAGDTWLQGSQKPMGNWRADGWSDADATLLVLDYFSQSGSMLEQVDGFLLMARDFFRKAEELAYEGGVNNRRLSAIAAVHAVEMFLYGLFERRDDLGISAFVQRGDQTLGPRESLATLQRRLQEEGLLANNRQLSYRDQLSSLVGHRDMIIHRASEISTEELQRGIKTAERFISKYGADLLTLDLLQ